MKKRMLKTGSLVLIALFTLASCNNSGSNNNITEEMADGNNMQDETEEAVDKVKDEWGDLKEEVNEVVNEKDRSEFQKKAENVMDKYEEKLEDFGNNMEDEWDRETREMYYEIQQARNNIDTQIEKTGDFAENEWDEFKTEMQNFADDVNKLFENS